ncbi:MAG: prepilin-type N-terminal cleavage/methylation domain-containing protein [Patescibacteria group bacterium]
MDIKAVKIYLKKIQHHIKVGAGFTLLELLVSVSILGMITGISLMNYRGSTKSTALQLESHKIVGDLRKAQTMALGAIEFSGSVPLGGWGVSFTSGASEYYVFADIDNDGVYDAVGELLTTVLLENSITFSASGNITFTPPDPLTFIDGVNAGEKTITITNGVRTKSIVVNFLGLIDISEE